MPTRRALRHTCRIDRAVRVAILTAAPAFAAAGATLSPCGCGSSTPVSHIEDKARLDVPIAICRKSLAGGDVADAGAPRTDAYWSTVFPSFRGFGTTLHPEDLDCVGDRPAVEFAGASGGGAPIAADDLTVSTAPDGMQVVWFRVARESPTVAAGELALIRPRTSEIDVYSVGRYKGSIQHSQFDISHIGTSPLIVARDQGCADVKVDVECTSTYDLYLGAAGKLTPAAQTPAERLQFGTLKGVGHVKYRLTTTPPVVDGRSVRVHEKLQVRDANDEDVRKAEGDRVFVLGADGKMVPQQDSLWSQVTRDQ